MVIIHYLINVVKNICWFIKCFNNIFNDANDNNNDYKLFNNHISLDIHPYMFIQENSLIIKIKILIFLSHLL